MSFTSQTTVREVLRQRPRAVEVFETAAGEAFWNYRDCALSELCADQSLDIGPLLARLDNLPSSDQVEDFESRPMYELVDRLAGDHRRYRDQELPRLEKLLEKTRPEDLPEGFPLETLRTGFHAFKIDFLLHMNEEEDFLFPKVLRTEGSVEHPGLASEVFTGSVNAYRGTMLHTPEAQIRKMLEALRLPSSLSHGQAVETQASDRIRSCLDNLEKDIVHHADLETEILLPRTLQLERDLKNRAANPFRELT